MKTEIASKQEFDFDAFAIGQWDIKLPSLLIRRRQRSPSPARSRPVCSRADQIKKVALEDSILGRRLVLNPTIGFYHSGPGIVNNRCVGYWMIFGFINS